MASLSLLDLPSIVVLTLGPYLTPHDLLALRVTCRTTHTWLHSTGNHQESNQLWLLLLQRDYGFDPLEMDWKETISVATETDGESSIFGISPRRNDFLVPQSDPFETWKAWYKVRSRFLGSTTTTDYNSSFHGPYFVRAARFWKSIFQWCGQQEQRQLGTVAIRLSISDQMGLKLSDWEPSTRRQPGLRAAFAVFSFTAGQQWDGRRSGLMGGYNAYDFVSSTFLFGRGSLTTSGDFVVACDSYAPVRGLKKEFVVKAGTGALECLATNGINRSAVRRPEPGSNRQDDFLKWLEEHCFRMTHAQVRTELFAHNSYALTLYPQISSDTEPGFLSDSHIPTMVSRAVTRGVEVEASAVLVPQSSQLGFIYSIRVRLLTPGEVGYQTVEQRGFGTCQLLSRHWQITNSATGQVDRVDGEGVIGMFPLLFEGGFEESGERGEGAFKYQSCTGPNVERGSFAGYMEFVKGSLQNRGNSFRVQVHPFELCDEPDFLY